MGLIALTVLLASLGGADVASEAPKESVVLLHGMGRSRASMWLLEKRLHDGGYATFNFPYAATTETLDELSDRLHAFLREKVKTERYHLVTHSLGGIIVRNAFKKEYRPGLGRIVMLAPPNKPAYLAQKLKDVAPYRWLNGDSGQKLSSEEFYKTLPVPSVEFGVVAGNRGNGLVFDEPNDGIVTVESTRMPEMKDFILLHHTHTFMMNSRDTADHCIRFLRTGRFQ